LKDNGFLEDKGPGTVGDLLKARPRDVIVARKGEKISQLIEDMKRHASRRCRGRQRRGRGGLIHEYDLLNGLIAARTRWRRDRSADRSAAGRGDAGDEHQQAARGVRSGQRRRWCGKGRRSPRWVTKIDLIEFLAARAA